MNNCQNVIVLSRASMVRPQDQDFKTYKLYVKDFMDLNQNTNGVHQNL
jgi:hypothetical protein